MQTQVGVGITTIIGYLTTFAGLIPMLVRLLEEGHTGLTLAGPEKYAATLSIVAFGLTKIGRYVQAAIIAKRPPALPSEVTV